MTEVASEQHRNNAGGAGEVGGSAAQYVRTLELEGEERAEGWEWRAGRAWAVWRNGMPPCAW